MKLDWFPLYIHRIKASERWRKMQDFERGWYITLLIESVDYKVQGYLPDDPEVLWRLAGAKTKAYFQREGQSVLQCFDGRTDDGKLRYNPALLATLEEQIAKLSRTRKRKEVETSLSLSSDFVVAIWKDYPEERRKEKPKAIQEIKKAIERLTKSTLAEYQDRFGKTRLVPITSELDASQFLHEALLEYRESPEGRRVQFVPYPERWFKREKYLEPRAGWFLEERADGNRASAKESERRAAIAGAIGKRAFGQSNGECLSVVPQPRGHGGHSGSVVRALGNTLPEDGKGEI